MRTVTQSPQAVTAAVDSNHRGGGAAVVYSNSGNSGSSDTSSYSDSEGSEVEYASDVGYAIVQVYVDYIDVEVPVTTTCLTTGTIVIENNITIDVTVAPTVDSHNVLLIVDHYIHYNVDSDGNNNRNNNENRNCKSHFPSPSNKLSITIPIRIPQPDISQFVDPLDDLLGSAFIVETNCRTHSTPKVLLAL
jgi:hypothetical protein